MQKTVVRFLFFALVMGFFISCKGIRQITDSIIQPSAREIYAREFSPDDSLFLQWNSFFENAINSRLQLTDPTVLNVSVQDVVSQALGYSMELKQGDLLHIEINSDSLNQRFFLNLYAPSDIGYRNSTDVEIDDKKLITTIGKSGIYHIVFQPEINFTGRYQVRIYTQPSLRFPVAGKNNNAVQSFWGNDRDGGARIHEGVDIFADKGTPLIAAAKGTVLRTGNRGLGGKQVWLRDSESGNSLYYAHLDSVLVAVGQELKPGDTLGLVGNSGNAVTTAPHLHFGVYTRRGAVDPYPFIRKRRIPEASLSSFNTETIKISTNSNVRAGPGTEFASIGQFNQGDLVNALAVTDDWFHVQKDSMQGFVSGSLIE